MGKIYLQMYSFMDGTMNDSRENLRLAAEMGYDGVELFGPLLAIPAEELKSLLTNIIWNRSQCMRRLPIWYEHAHSSLPMLLT